MNGTKFVLDTNTVIALIKGSPVSATVTENLRRSKQFVSVITRMELFAYSNLSADEEAKIRSLLKTCKVIPLNRKIEHEATSLRRGGTPKIKLPDAIIAATAVVLGARLITGDVGLLGLSWPGLQTMSMV
jgi:predicted nucleic acid-binding protein